MAWYCEECGCSDGTVRQYVIKDDDDDNEDDNEDDDGGRVVGRIHYLCDDCAPNGLRGNSGITGLTKKLFIKSKRNPNPPGTIAVKRIYSAPGKAYNSVKSGQDPFSYVMKGENYERAAINIKRKMGAVKGFFSKFKKKRDIE